MGEAAVLVPSADGDDYAREGVMEAEEFANKGRAFHIVEVSQGLRTVEWAGYPNPTRQSVGIFTGRISLQKHVIPPILRGNEIPEATLS